MKQKPWNNIEEEIKFYKGEADRLRKISEAMDEGIWEGMNAENCWSRACAISNGEVTYYSSRSSDHDTPIEEF